MLCPFTTRRRVLWGDCDPAGVIYTPQVFHYTIEAIEEWLLATLGFNWMELQKKFSLDTPSIKITCEFITPLKAGDFVDIKLLVKKLGNTSIEYIIDGFNMNGERCFSLNQISCFVDAETFKPVPIISEFRYKIIEYQKCCNDKFTEEN